MASFNDIRIGNTSKFMVEKPDSTSDVVDRINKVNLNNCIVLGYLHKHPSKHIAEYTSPGVGWFLLKILPCLQMAYVKV